MNNGQVSNLPVRFYNLSIVWVGIKPTQIFPYDSYLCSSIVCFYNQLYIFAVKLYLNSNKYKKIVIMAIAIRPIPVLKGTTAERFEEMVENNKQTAFTVIPDNMRQAVHAMQEKSRNVVIKMPKR